MHPSVELEVPKIYPVSSDYIATTPQVIDIQTSYTWWFSPCDRQELSFSQDSGSPGFVHLQRMSVFRGAFTEM